MRPLPEQAYDAARANNEYAAFWGDSFVKKWKAEQPSPPAGARERKENEVMKTIRDANGTTMWWGKPLAGRGEAAEQEQNKAGISASSGTTFITSSAPNERPASSPAGARESAEQFFNSLPEETKYKWAGEVKPHWAFAFAEAYAKKERERADAAERQLEAKTAEVESLRTELREIKQKLERWAGDSLIDKLDRLILQWEERANWGREQALKRESAERELGDMQEALEHLRWKNHIYAPNGCDACAKAEALLSRKGEGS